MQPCPDCILTGKHVGQSLHEANEAHHLKSSSTLPQELCKLSKENGSGDTPSKLSDLATVCQLPVSNALQFWQQVKSPPDLKTFCHSGLDSSIQQAPHHGERLVAMELLVLGDQTRPATLPILKQSCQGRCHAARLMEDQTEILD